MYRGGGLLRFSWEQKSETVKGTNNRYSDFTNMLQPWKMAGKSLPKITSVCNSHSLRAAKVKDVFKVESFFQQCYIFPVGVVHA